MGLDSVELLWEFERRFGIRIPDQAAADMRTTQDVVDYVYQVVGGEWHPCPTQHAFYRLRRALGSAERLRPSTQLEAILPVADRRERWRHLESASSLPCWPALERPGQVVVGALLSAISLAALVGLWSHSRGMFGVSLMLFLVLAPVLTRHFARQFPARLATAGDLCRCVAAEYRPPAGTWTRANVREAVRGAVRIQLGLQEHEFSDDDAFVDDLGID